MTHKGEVGTSEQETSTPFVSSVETGPRQRLTRLTKRGSLEALSFRVLELLEGLNERQAIDSSTNKPSKLETKLLHFQQKLQSINSDSAKMLTKEFEELKNSVVQTQTKKVNSSLLGELVETVQVLLRDSSPHHEGGKTSKVPGMTSQTLLRRIEEKLRQLERKKTPEVDFKEFFTMLHTINQETEMLVSKIQSLDSDRGDLVRLVSSGQEILADMAKENESLEHQLTLHISSQTSNLLGFDQSEEPEALTDSQRSESVKGSWNDPDFLRVLFKEKTRAEVLDQQAKNLAIQVTNGQKEVEQLKSEKQDLLVALDQSSWKEEREKLVQVLEEEKDKVSAWREEIEDLEQQLKSTLRSNEVLKIEKEGLQRAVKETTWAEDRENILLEFSEQKTKVLELTEILKVKEERLGKEIKLRENMEQRINELKVKDSNDEDANCNKQEICLKLEVAEKQNKILELRSELELEKLRVLDYESRLEDNQIELEDLRHQLEEVSWTEEKKQLLEALEEEIEKRSSWEEEQVALEQQVYGLTEEVANLKEANAALAASVDEISWSKEREELCEALEEEKEKLSSWREEMEALEEENKELKRVFHEAKDKDLIIRDKNEALESSAEKIEVLESKINVREEEIRALSSTLSENPESWIREKVELLKKLADLELAHTSLQDTLKLEHSKQQSCFLRIEELEIELDRVQRDMNNLKTTGAVKKTKHVSWGSNQILQMDEELIEDYHPPSLSIHITKSNSRFAEDLEDKANCLQSADSTNSMSELHCDLAIRVPHQRSKSIPPTIQL